MDQNLILMETMLHQRGEKKGGHEQIISSHHPVGDEVAKMETDVYCQHLLGEKGKTRPEESPSEF